jgi:hypothetical protein
VQVEASRARQSYQEVQDVEEITMAQLSGSRCSGAMVIAHRSCAREQ